jgi:hypothetical protein
MLKPLNDSAIYLTSHYIPLQPSFAVSASMLFTPMAMRYQLRLRRVRFTRRDEVFYGSYVDHSELHLAPMRRSANVSVLHTVNFERLQQEYRVVDNCKTVVLDSSRLDGYLQKKNKADAIIKQDSQRDNQRSQHDNQGTSSASASSSVNQAATVSRACITDDAKMIQDCELTKHLQQRSTQESATVEMTRGLVDDYNYRSLQVMYAGLPSVV